MVIFLLTLDCLICLVIIILASVVFAVRICQTFMEVVEEADCLFRLFFGLVVLFAFIPVLATYLCLFVRMWCGAGFSLLLGSIVKLSDSLATLLDRLFECASVLLSLAAFRFVFLLLAFLHFSSHSFNVLELVRLKRAEN